MKAIIVQGCKTDHGVWSCKDIQQCLLMALVWQVRGIWLPVQSAKDFFNIRGIR